MSKDILSEQGIKSYLKNCEDYRISVLDTVTSTNAILKEQAQNGENEWAVIIAESQTAGRGRMTRKFESPNGIGIYMSILLKPTMPAENSVLITAAAAAAVSLTVEEISGKTTRIKWVNDVLINNKKICGILTEGGIDLKTGGFSWAVLGIGINVYEPSGGFSEEISGIAGAVFKNKTPDLRNRIAAEVINRFRKFYSELESKIFFADYKSRMLTMGQNVSVIKGESVREAVCLDLDDRCRLLVEYGDGSREFLSSGEISVKLT